MVPIIKILQWGSITTNLLLYGYILFLHETIYDYFLDEHLLDVSRRVVHEGAGNAAFAALMLLLTAGDVLAFHWKTRHSPIKEDLSGGLFVLWLFHTVVTVIMTMLGLEAAGLGLEKNAPVATPVLFLVVIKELVILVLIYTAHPKPGVSKIKSVAADVFFALYYSIAYTVVIGNILITNNYDNYLLAFWYSKVGLAMNTVLVLLLFFMFYMPLRLPYLIVEEERSNGRQILSLIAMALVAVAAVSPLFQGQYSLEKALKAPDRVQLLFLNGRELNQVPESISRLSQLRVLHLGFNRLHTLPTGFSKLEQLEWLNLGGNGFREVPPQVMALPSLKELDLHYNRIKQLPDDLSPFLKLKKLHLRSNWLSPSERRRIIGFLGAKRVSFKSTN